MATNEELIAAARLIAKCYSAGNDPAIVDPAAEAMEQALAKLEDEEKVTALAIKNLFLGKPILIHTANPMTLERVKEITELLGGTYEAADHAVMAESGAPTDRCGILFHPPGKAAA